MHGGAGRVGVRRKKLNLDMATCAAVCPASPGRRLEKQGFPLFLTLPGHQQRLASEIVAFFMAIRLPH
jgi:hypothetical protein